MRRTARLTLLVMLFALVGMLLAPSRADALAVSECHPNSPGHYTTTIDVSGQSCCNNHCVIGHQFCEWDCVSDPDGSGNTHPDNTVCHSPDWCALGTGCMHCCNGMC
jgi:hypothetical protein